MATVRHFEYRCQSHMHGVPQWGVPRTFTFHSWSSAWRPCWLRMLLCSGGCRSFCSTCGTVTRISIDQGLPSNLLRRCRLTGWIRMLMCTPMPHGADRMSVQYRHARTIKIVMPPGNAEHLAELIVGLCSLLLPAAAIARHRSRPQSHLSAPQGFATSASAAIAPHRRGMRFSRLAAAAAAVGKTARRLLPVECTGTRRAEMAVKLLLRHAAIVWPESLPHLRFRR